MTELEKRMAYGRMLEAMRQLEHIGAVTTDEDVLNWIERTMIECIDLMQDKLGRTNDFALKTFRTLRLKKSTDMTNEEIANEVGLTENTVRVIIKEMKVS